MSGFAFQYKHGDRPLDGYTIQRAAGRGGFGEVYYAISDSGREVALKAILGYEQIELRGISQCMNLKSPHLVSIFDVKYNGQGRPFVLMEYVAGPSLRQLLDESPNGMGPQKAAFFLREIAKGLSFLHECGIVHRDLKPANVFYENGYVKIGDYGLSKAMSVGQHTTQTITVGTVHYMAPEIGAGKYDRGIDIYALGAVLYEMLTGRTPHTGTSAGEILMKHMSAEPDCTGIDEPFATVIKKAMAKDPNQRYQNAQEMVESLFGVDHIQQSVSCFSPDELTIVANRVAAKVAAVGAAPGQWGGSSGPVATATSPADGRLGSGPPPTDVWMKIGDWVDHAGSRVGTGVNRLAAMGLCKNADEAAATVDPALDPLPRRQRRILSFLTAIILGVAAGVAGEDSRVPPPAPLFFAIAAIAVTSMAILIGTRRIAPRLTSLKPGGRRFVIGFGAAALCMVATLPFWPVDTFFSSALALAIPLAVLPWPAWVAPVRPARVVGRRVAGAVLFAGILCAMFEGNVPASVAAMAGIVLIVQIASPWVATGAPASNTPRGRERKATAAAAAHGYAKPPVSAPPPPPSEGTPHNTSTAVAPSSSGPVPAYRRIPQGVRLMWAGLAAPLIALGVVLLFVPGMDRRVESDVVVAAVCGGISSILLAACCITRACVRKARSWWGYLFKPFLMTLMLCVAITCFVLMVGIRDMPPEGNMVSLFFLILSVLAFVVFALIPAGPGRLARSAVATRSVSPYERRMALGFTIFALIGLAGVQRFYVGRVWTGILWLVTGGLFGIGQLYDVVMLLFGDFKDSRGRVLRLWGDEEESARRSILAAPAGNAAYAVEAAYASPAVQEQQMGSMYQRQDMSPMPAMTPMAPMTPMEWKSPLPPAPAIEKAPKRRTSLFLSLLGGLFLIVGVVLGLGLTFDVPGMLSAGVPDPHIAADLRRAFGTSEWPELLSTLMRGLLLAAVTCSAALLIMARRRAGFLHVIRGLVGPFGLLAALASLHNVLRDYNPWPQVAAAEHGQRIAVAVQKIVSVPNGQAVIPAIALFLTSVIMLAWPEPTPKTAREVAPASPQLQGA